MIAKNIQDDFVHVSALRVRGKGTYCNTFVLCWFENPNTVVQVILKNDFLKIRKAIKTNC